MTRPSPAPLVLDAHFSRASKGTGPAAFTAFLLSIGQARGSPEREPIESDASAPRTPARPPRRHFDTIRADRSRQEPDLQGPLVVRGLSEETGDMDKSDFDALTRLLSNPGSRRRALAVLGGALGLSTWHGGPDVALAK